MRGNLLCKREQSETQFQLYRVQPATDESQIAVLEVKTPFVDFDRRDCTALSLRRFFFKSIKEDKRWRCAVMTK